MHVNLHDPVGNSQPVCYVLVRQTAGSQLGDFHLAAAELAPVWNMGNALAQQEAGEAGIHPPLAALDRGKAMLDVVCQGGAQEKSVDVQPQKIIDGAMVVRLG